MRRSSVVIVLVCTLFLIPRLFAETNEDVLAVVNGEKILLGEFIAMANPIINKKKFSRDEANDIKNKLLNQMIDDRVLRQEAKKQNISVTSSDLDKGIQQVKSRFSSEALFKDELKREGINYGQFKQRIADQIQVMKLIEMCISSQYNQDEAQKQYDGWIKQLRSGRYIWISPDIEWIKINASGDINNKSVPATIKNVAVSDFDAVGVEASEAITVTDIVRGDLVGSSRYSVMDRKNMELLLSEQKLQLSGGTSQENAAKLGKILNVQAIVVGSVSKLMGEYIITVSIVDVETGLILTSFNEKATDLDEIRSACKRLSNNLCK